MLSLFLNVDPGKPGYQGHARGTTANMYAGFRVHLDNVDLTRVGSVQGKTKIGFQIDLLFHKINMGTLFSCTKAYSGQELDKEDSDLSPIAPDDRLQPPEVIWPTVEEATKYLKDNFLDVNSSLVRGQLCLR